jgi:2-dehydropantoate 2-reductase
MDVTIVGTGAMACLFAARMAGAGLAVTMLGRWPEALEALHRDGVRLVDLEGGEHVYPVRVVADSRDCIRTSAALVLVKAWQTSRAADQLTQFLSPDGLALTLQNGLGNREALTNVLGASRVALGVTTAGATLTAPGQVREAGRGKVTLGAHPRLEPLADCLHSAGFAVEVVSDPNALLWGKLVINAAINPLTALLRVPNGELLQRPTARALMAEAAREAAAVAAAQDIRLPYPDPVAVVEEVALRTAKNYSSMLQDVLRGAPTEIDAISGAIVRAGEEHGMPTLVNRTLWRLVKGLKSEEI